MSKNAHDTIIDAIVALLKSGTPLAPEIAEDDPAAVPEETASAIHVVFIGSTPDEPAMLGTNAPRDWTTEITLECYARADQAGSTGRISRRLHAQAYTRLMADQTLGGLVFTITPSAITVDQDSQSTRLGCCIGHYRLQHRTTQNTLEL